MIIGSLPFAHYLAMMRGGWRSLLNDPQVRWFLILVTSLVLLLCWNLTQNGQPLGSGLRQAFNGVSIMTGTGFVSANYSIWEDLRLPFCCWSCLLAATGSTTCGIKVFRLQVLAATVKVQINRLLKPHAVVLAYYNRRPVSTEVMDSVMGFFYLYILGFVLIAILLALSGLDFVTALSGAATSISNVGPGLGEVIGAEGNFSSLPDMAKWIMSLPCFLVSIFTVLVMLNPEFWRR